MQQERIKKLEGVIQELVSTFIFEEIWEIGDDFWVITITGVKVSTDLSYLDIFISCFKNQETLAKALAKHAHDIQRKLHNALSLRKIPRIRFRYDEGGAIAWDLNWKINDLTKNIEINYDK